jgi:uncharacterized protein YPO0396
VPNSKRFLAAFGRAVAFSPICDPARFVREYILEQDDLDIERVASIAAWREAERAVNDTKGSEVSNLAAEMSRVLAEEFLAKLGAKLVEAKQKLADINSRLAKHPVNGRVYALSSNADHRFEAIHDLAMRGASSSDGSLMRLEASDIKEVAAQFECMVNSDDPTGKLMDYREYFNFDIVMTDEAGASTTISSRAAKGSAGEALEPFYVAMAVALSSVYFPNEAPTGMGLVMFDEAFSKLDVSSARTLLNLYGDMNLQPIITAPERRRATFAELVDTVVVVNKTPSGQAAFI